MRLADEINYKKNQLFNYDKEVYWKVSPFGAGNCGLYAFTCGLIDSIVNHKLIIETEKFDVFKETIKETLLNPKLDIILSSEAYVLDELKPELYAFSKFIQQPDFNFSSFKNFLTESLTRKRVVAINLLCGQALRKIGFMSYTKRFGIEAEEDKHLLLSGENVGQEVLNPLANYFGLHIKLISKPDEKGSPYYHADLPKNVTPAFALLLEGSHWHYLLPKEQNLGIAAVLPFSNKPEYKSRNLLQSNKQLIQEMINHYADFTKNSLDKFAATLKQIYLSLEEVFSHERDQTKEFEQAAEQAKNAAKESTQPINFLRKTYGDDYQLDVHLNNLGLHDLEKELIKNPLIGDNSADAAMATILQNEEIINFLSRNYATLTSLNALTSPHSPTSYRSEHSQCVKEHDQKNAPPCILVSS